MAYANIRARNPYYKGPSLYAAPLRTPTTMNNTRLEF
jgi:hypothetical protein